MSGKVELKLSNRPDGYGFIYGTAQLGDATCRVNILPPTAEWSGDEKLPGYNRDPDCWIVFADGEEIARVKTEAGLIEALLPRLSR